jgi:hypothetical protein
MLSAQPPSIKTEIERICYEIPDPMPRNTHVVPDASSGPSNRAGQSAAGAPGFSICETWEAHRKRSQDRVTAKLASRTAFPAPEQNLNPTPLDYFPAA